MESKWLSGRKEVLEKYKQQVKRKGSIMLIGFTIAFAVAFAAIFMALSGQERSGSLFVVGFTYFIVLLICLLLPLKTKKLSTKDTEQTLQSYLKTSEEVAAFDKEALAHPKAELQIGGGLGLRKFKLTDHWLIIEDPIYVTNDRVLKKEDITYIHGTKFGQGEYGIDICTHDQKVLKSFFPLTKKDYFALLDFTLTHFPEADWKAYTKGMPKKAS
ncbi:MAG: hypothetical protein ACRCTE_09380 [Cellulosilyticaceae bacterium]